MDPDEIGGSCPRCDAEFRPGFTECPDCGIPLLGVDESAPPGPPPPPVDVLTVDPDWSGRLTAVAAACIGAIVLAVLGFVVRALGLDAEQMGPISDDVFLQQRITYVARAASPGLAVVALVAGLAVALAGRLRARTRLDTGVQWATFGAAILLVGLAAVGLVADLRWNANGLPWSRRTWMASTWISTAVVAVAAALVTDLLAPRAAPEELE